ncbi:MAG: dihydrofolate reductase family protein [Gemmatimonadetes bacterium]|nr:dihydrofolate reductase family protein [Gemmatimonadota bacterium]
MSKVKVLAFSISLDGFGAGPNQGLETPMGEGGMALHQWFMKTRAFRSATGHGGDDAAAEGGAAPSGDADASGDSGATAAENPSERFARDAMSNLGAWILGRNMFGPVRGPWPDDEWKGWWGDEPPYHVPVFVLTHHKRAPLEMAGGTTFHFVTGGAQEALARAREAAGGRDIRVGGGPSTVRQYLAAGQIDEMHLAISPALLGRGEPLLAGIDLVAGGFRVAEHVPTADATHVVLRRG